MPPERTIRKYANRRLYDTRESRHVTLEDIRKMIAHGEQVKVIEEKTGADVTRALLLQIVANQELLGRPVLSTQLLEALVRFHGNPVQEMLISYLEQSIGTLLQQQQRMQDEMARMLQTPMAPLTELAQRNVQLWAKMQASLLEALAPPHTQKSGDPRPKPDSGKRSK